MLTTLLVLVLALLVIGALLIVGFISYVKSQDRKKRTIPTIDANTPSSKTDTCSRCGEKRIIVNRDDTLCASCYSALRTKKLG